jgi:hypothetical protein
MSVAFREHVLGETGGEGERLSGPAQEDYENRAWPREYLTNARVREAERAFAQIAAASAAHPRRLLDTSWELAGPVDPYVPYLSTYTFRETNVSGRITALAIGPTCGPGDCRLWVGAAGGGVWRTDDALAAEPVWTPLDEGINTNAIGSIAVDPNDPTGDTIYVGTGEPNGSGDSEAGRGLFRSTDGGDQWTKVPGSGEVATDRSVGYIAIDPTDADHIFIGTAVARHGSSSVNGGRRTPPGAPPLGLYESTDGGDTFDLVFSLPPHPLPPETGLDFFHGGVNRIEIDPNDPETLYVAMFGYGVWRRSPALDGDSDFHQVFATFNPDDFFGDRTEFDLVDMGAATRIYVGDSSDDLAYSALFRVDDANVPASSLTDGVDNIGWTSLSSDTPGDPGFGSWFYCHFQCGYDQFVNSPPDRPDEVWIGGAMNYDEIFGGAPWRSNGRAVMRSTDAGGTWDDMTNDAQDPPLGMHPDQHEIVWSPDDPDVAFIGSDGGLVRLEGSYTDTSAQCADRGLDPPDLANCEDWLEAVPAEIFPINNGLATLQFQSVSVNPTDPYELLGGTQDNGTWNNVASVGYISSEWYETINGDGGQSGFDAGDPDVTFHTYFEASPDVNFRDNDPYWWNWIGDPLFETEPQSFYIPIIADPVVPGTIYAGLSGVWRTFDNGGDQAYLEEHCNWYEGDFAAPCGDWVKLGGEAGPKNLTSPEYGNRAGHFVVAVERAPSDERTLWAATRIGRLFVTKNAKDKTRHVAFVRIDDDAATPGRFISGIAIDPANPNHAWISYSGYNAYTPNRKGHVFEVRYHPKTQTSEWRNRSSNLGDQPILDVVYDDVTGDLYVATDWGVLRRAAGTTKWRQAAAGLPKVASYGITIVPEARLLYAATHGRSIWMLELP